MKINDISCTQFAGIRDYHISLEGGLNIIYGKNESGKSTLVNLILSTLFQDSKLDRRKDKEFFAFCFPSAYKSGTINGDFIDGKISFLTDNNVYILSKKWGSNPSCTLSTPQGVIENQEKINDILLQFLLYHKGVYSDMLLSSQKNMDNSLQTILDASQKTETKQEITDTISKAFVESNGISMDTIESAINKKIDEITGKHWDSSLEKPVYKAGGGRWSKDLGEILKAYYVLKDAEDTVLELSRLKAAVDSAAIDFTQKDNDARSAEEAYHSFTVYSNRLTLRKKNQETIDRLTNDIERYNHILNHWPEYIDCLKKAETLKNEKDTRELLDKYKKAEQIITERNSLTQNPVLSICPTNQEILDIKTAQTNLASLENQLCGMNLNAVIQAFGSNTVEIKSLRTGEMIHFSEDTVSITEAVSITVPNVIEIHLSPANVDVTEIKNKINHQKDMINSIFKTYNVDNLNALETLKSNISDLRTKIDICNHKLSIEFNTITAEEAENKLTELEQKVQKIDNANTKIRSSEEIKHDIDTLCKDTDLDQYITEKQTQIKGYIQEFESIDQLKKKVSSNNSELETAKTEIASISDIPPEYLDITDPNQYLSTLRDNVTSAHDKREHSLTEKTTAISNLNSYQEKISEHPATEVEKAREAFMEQKALLQHWTHIKQVFDKQKADISNHPMCDIAEQFTHYLKIISNDRVSSEFPEEDKLNIKVYSNNRLLDYSILSEGTKETVFLAFRLAVLDHLFPDGDGIIVFDDPFTDMDAERTAQSCKLIQDCASRHQVIFLTCKEEYLGMLQGKVIKLD